MGDRVLTQAAIQADILAVIQQAAWMTNIHLQLAD